MDWSGELADRLGRTRESILEKGLSAYDFSPCASVEIRQSGGMTIHFRFAFAIVRPATGEAVVFSENNGYVEFDLRQDDVVAEIVETVYRQE
jgi:hypothetical protein